MSPEAEDIFRRVMALPEDARWEVIDRLVVAAHEAGHESSFAPDVADDWDAEIARRIKEIDEGKVKMISGEEFLRDSRERIERIKRDAGI